MLVLVTGFLLVPQLPQVGQFFELFLPEHGTLNICVVLEVLVDSELFLGHLAHSFFVQISLVDLFLERFDLVAFLADLVDLLCVPLARHLHASHLAGELLLHKAVLGVDLVPAHAAYHLK